MACAGDFLRGKGGGPRKEGDAVCYDGKIHLLIIMLISISKREQLMGGDAILFLMCGELYLRQYNEQMACQKYSCKII